jgi:hypothetical protein
MYVAVAMCWHSSLWFVLRPMQLPGHNLQHIQTCPVINVASITLVLTHTEWCKLIYITKNLLVLPFCIRFSAAILWLCTHSCLLHCKWDMHLHLTRVCGTVMKYSIPFILILSNTSLFTPTKYTIFIHYIHVCLTHVSVLHSPSSGGTYVPLTQKQELLCSHYLWLLH